MGYNESMTALADAVRAKSGATGKLTVDQMTEAVNGITSGGGEGGGGTDTSDATVTADKLLKGVTAYGANGKVTGSIETVTPTLTDNIFTVPSGFIEESQTLTVPEIPPVSVHLNGVSIGPGYNPESKSITVGKIASITEVTPGTSAVVIPADTYIAGDLTILGDSNLTPENIKEGVSIFGVVGSFAGGGGGSMEFYRCTEVFGPKNITYITISGAGTTDCNGRYAEAGVKNGDTLYSYTSPSGTTWYIYYIDSEYEEESSWVLSDRLDVSYGWNAHYYANDIKEDWWVGEAGANEPSPSAVMGKETINADQPKTWKGKLAVLDNGEYTFAADVTEGLVYGDQYRPEVGRVYNNGADIQASLWGGSVIVYIPFDDGTTVDYSMDGHSVTASGGTAVTVGDRKAWNFNRGYIAINPKKEEFVFDGDFTIKADIYPTSSDRQCIFAYKSDGVFAIAYSYDGDRKLSLFIDGNWGPTQLSEPIPLNTWTEIVIQRKDGVISCFVNKTKTAYTMDSTREIGRSGQYVSFGRWGDDPGDFASRWIGYMDEIAIRNAALY